MSHRFSCTPCFFHSNSKASYHKHILSKNHSLLCNNIHVSRKQHDYPQIRAPRPPKHNKDDVVCHVCKLSFSKISNLNRHLANNVCLKTQNDLVHKQIIATQPIVLPNNPLVSDDITRDYPPPSYSLFSIYPPSFISYFDFLSVLHNLDNTPFSSRRYDDLIKSEKSSLDRQIVSILFNSNLDHFRLLTNALLLNHSPSLNILFPVSRSSPVKSRLTYILRELADSLSPPLHQHWSDVRNILLSNNP